MHKTMKLTNMKNKKKINNNRITQSLDFDYSSSYNPDEISKGDVTFASLTLEVANDLRQD